jgi:hypothetical protein
MKKVFLSIVAIAALVVLPMSVSAQNFVNTNGFDDENSTATSTAAAKIITPIKVELLSGSLDFGTIVSPPADAWVKITPAAVRSASDEEIIMATTEVGGVPTFKVTGHVGYAYSLQLPDDNDVVLSAGGVDLVVKAFESNLGSSPVIATDGTEFQVGATIEIPEGVAPNTYEGEFDVIVAYN